MAAVAVETIMGQLVRCRMVAWVVVVVVVGIAVEQQAQLTRVVVVVGH